MAQPTHFRPLPAHCLAGGAKCVNRPKKTKNCVLPSCAQPPSPQCRHRLQTPVSRFLGQRAASAQPANQTRSKATQQDGARSGDDGAHGLYHDDKVGVIPIAAVIEILKGQHVLVSAPQTRRKWKDLHCVNALALIGGHVIDVVPVETRVTVPDTKRIIVAGCRIHIVTERIARKVDAAVDTTYDDASVGEN